MVNSTLCHKTSTFLFFNQLCQKLNDFNDFLCVKSWETLSSTACTLAHFTCILQPLYLVKSKKSYFSTVLLGRIAHVAQRPIVVKLSPWTICRSVRRSVCRCVGMSSALWKNGGLDAVWHHRSDGTRDEARSGVWESVHRKGYFWGRTSGLPL